MKLVVQRVKSACLKVEGEEISKIKEGLVVYVGFAKDEKIESLEFFAKKLVNLRIFEDNNNKMNLSVKDIFGEILLVSQFTLLADTSHGNRPSFFEAELPQKAKELYDKFAELISAQGVNVSMGVFGACMQIYQHNDGPVTIVF